MTRRDLIRTATGFAAAAATARPASQTLKAGIQTNAWKIIGDDFSSLLGVLEHIRSLGYEGFETGFRDVQPAFGKLKDAKAQIAETGLRFLGCHISLSNYDSKTNIAPTEQIEQVADGAAGLGAERLILSGAPVSEEGPLDEQRVRWKAGALSRAGRHCQGMKLRVCYHNRAAEFANGAAELIGLMRETDPDSVRFMIDAGYALTAKADIAGFFTKYHKRIDGLHLREFNAFQYEPLAIAIKKAKWTGWLVAGEERENGAKPGDEAARPAREQIRKLFGV